MHRDRGEASPRHPVDGRGHRHPCRGSVQSECLIFLLNYTFGLEPDEVIHAKIRIMFIFNL